jgi:hypothetical protein
MTKKVIFSSIFILLISIETYAQSKRVDRMRDEFIQSAFLTVNKQLTFIVKWENKDTLKYYIDGTFQFISKKSWNKYINEVSSLIEKHIVEIENPTEADIHIYFGELSDYFTTYNISYRNDIKVNLNFDNWESRRYNNKRQLLSTSFCIVPSKTSSIDRGDYNIRRMFLKSLGLLGTTESRISLFNFNSIEPVIGLDNEDKRLIKLFYSDSIKAGMNLDEVNKALQTLDLEALCNEKP